MNRKKATDFPQELLDLLDLYVHGGIGRREFLAGAQKFATVGGVSAAALVEMLRPNYAWAIQVPEDDKRIKTENVTVPSPERHRPYRLLSGAARRGARQAAGRAGDPRKSRPQSLCQGCGAAAGDGRLHGAWRRTA